MFKRILLPTDGSERSREAAHAALELARMSGGRVLALHIVSPAIPDIAFMGLGAIGGPVPLDPPPAAPGSRHDPALIAVRRAAHAAGVPVESAQVVDSRPAEAIVGFAEAYGCDLIVMSTSRFGGLLSAIAGSTSARVFQGCDLPVLLVH